MATYQKQDQPLSVPTGSAGTETEKAKATRLFRERVPLLPGVLRVEQREDNTSGEASFRIFVRDGDRTTEYAIYQLEAEVYRHCQGAYLDVRVLGEADGMDDIWRTLTLHPSPPNCADAGLV